MLFNEPKLLKLLGHATLFDETSGFSALQRAEIAEIVEHQALERARECFSALQRAEIAEMRSSPSSDVVNS